MLYHLTLRAPILVWNHFFQALTALQPFLGQPTFYGQTPCEGGQTLDPKSAKHPVQATVRYRS